MGITRDGGECGKRIVRIVDRRISTDLSMRMKQYGISIRIGINGSVIPRNRGMAMIII